MRCFCLDPIFYEDIQQDDVILDVGCGDGRVLVTMAKVLGCRGIGIDISQVCTIGKDYLPVPKRPTAAEMALNCCFPHKRRTRRSIL